MHEECMRNASHQNAPESLSGRDRSPASQIGTRGKVLCISRYPGGGRKRNRVCAAASSMPTLNLSTNVPLDGVAVSDVLKDASKTVARIIGKPESYVMVLLKGSVPISFGGTEGPAAYGEVVSIGGLSPDVNKRLSKAVAELLESKLSVPPNRFYIKFVDVERTDFGWNGSTF